SAKGSPTCGNLQAPGPDVDFTASPVLARGANGHDILVAGRKDGTILGVDPDTGAIVWTQRRGRQGDVRDGEFFFGLMAGNGSVYIPSISTRRPSPTTPIPSSSNGLYALDVATGKLAWDAGVATDCARPSGCLGLASAPIGTSSLLFAGSADGYVRAYEAASGKVLWRFDTARQFQTLNGDSAKGSAVNRNGIMVAHGMLYVNSGYGPTPGNVLLAFTLDDRKSAAP